MLSNYEIKRRFDLCYGDGAYVQAATYYFALMASTPNRTGGGVEFVIGVNAYARVAVATNNTNFPAATLGSAGSNGTAIVFPAPTGAWGTALFWAVYDAATAGNLIEYGPLSSPLTIAGAGAAPEFPIGGLTMDSN